MIGLVICQFPIVAAFTTHAVAGLLARLGSITVGKVTVPVFFRCQVGSPGRRPHGAVIEGSAGAGTIGTEFSEEFVIATNRAADFHFSTTGYPAVEWAAKHHIPLTVSILLNMNHGNAVGCDFFTNFICRAGAISIIGCALRMDGLLIDVLMVHNQETFSGAVAATLLVNREEVHAVMVHTHLLFLVCAGIGAISAIIRVRPGNRCAPGQECL